MKNKWFTLRTIFLLISVVWFLQSLSAVVRWTFPTEQSSIYAYMKGLHKNKKFTKINIGILRDKYKDNDLLLNLAQHKEDLESQKLKLIQGIGLSVIASSFSMMAGYKLIDSRDIFVILFTVGLSCGVWDYIALDSAEKEIKCIDDMIQILCTVDGMPQKTQ